MTSRFSTIFVKKMFSEVPATYEVTNHILTFWFDKMWRKRAAKIATKADGVLWANMCTGTGEMVCYLRRLAPTGTRIYGIDFSLPMLKEAKKKRMGKDICFVASDIKTLPFPSGCFDLVTMSFACRNINLNKDILVYSFSEIYRVLKPGGRFVNLETSRPKNLLIRWCFHLYVRLFVKAIGSRISGSRAAYAYLAKTIPRFYSSEELAGLMRQAGCSKSVFEQRLFGVAAIHHGIK
jgi:demethylmenaquinone methyltransferase/2-methoxy-6-polyprenyl-1,4-benzoquinol methylase